MPLVMKQAASAHPAAVIVVVTLVGAVFGLLGALLAVPMAVVADVLIRDLWFRGLNRQTKDPGSGS